MIVCADDYGLADDVENTILELCFAGRVSAVSCMVALGRCSSHSMSRLLACQAKVDIGLHFCLTDEELPLSKPSALEVKTGRLPSFGTLFRRCMVRALPPGSIRQELALQYQLFLDKANREPDFIDGHLHIHQLPGIREAVIDFVSSLSPSSRPYIRNTSLPLSRLRARNLPWFKAFLIGAFGKQMKKQLIASALPTNDGFAGIYDFKCWTRYPDFFPRFLECLEEPNGMLVVHPGASEIWRRQESETLRRFAFPAGEPKRFQRKHREPETVTPGDAS